MSLEIWDFVLPGFLGKFGPFFCDDRVMIVLMIKSTFGALEAQSRFWAPKWSVFGSLFWVCFVWSHFWIRYLGDLGRHMSAQAPNPKSRFYLFLLDSAIPVSPLQVEQPLAECFLVCGCCCCWCGVVGVFMGIHEDQWVQHQW